MTVPSRDEAARLLLSVDPPAWHIRHVRAVAEVAAWLALRATRRAGARHGGSNRTAVDRRLVEAAALLHDIGKTQPGTGSHGEAGARWLAARGHPELGEAVRLHPVSILADRAGATRLRAASLEAKIVAYADKRAGQRLEPLAERFAGWRRRYPDGWTGDEVAAAWRRSEALEREVCGAAGCRPAEVGRLRWTAAALAAAPAAGPTNDLAAATVVAAAGTR